MRSPRIPVKISPCSPQLEKIQERQQRRSASGKKNLPAYAGDTGDGSLISLGQEDTLDKEMATRSSILA